MLNIVKIIDFISGAASNVQEVNIWDGVSIKLKQGKYKLENVTPSQWIVANGRIMGKMIQEGTLSGREILDYWAYMVKFGELACRYSWATSLIYDDEYRQRQAQFKFRWGAEAPHLSTICLRERVPGNLKSKASTNIAKSALPNNKVSLSGAIKKGPNGKNVCWQFNGMSGNSCTFGQKCVYARKI